MVVTPFDDIPKVVFLRKILPPSSVLFVFFFMIMGIAASSAEFQDNQGPAAVLPFWEASFKLSGQFLGRFFHMPGNCLGTALSEFQASQCDQFWIDTFRDGSLVLAPLILMLFMIYLGVADLSKVYRRAQRKVKKGTPSLVGTVTHPPETAGDVFSWFYCFRPIMIQLQDGRQSKVYVPLDAPAPLSGETFVAFNLGTVMGETRQVAMLYAPHMAILRG